MGNNRLDYLEEERIKLWEAIGSLQPLKDDVLKTISAVDELRDAVAKKTSDYEAEAQNSATKAHSSKTLSDQALASIQATKLKIDEIFQAAESNGVDISEMAKHHQDVTQKAEDVTKAYSSIQELLGETQQKVTDADSKLEKATETLEEAQESKSKLEELEEAIITSEERINTLHEQVVKKSREVSTLHDKVFGYTLVDDDGEETEEVKGLKDELAVAYEGLKKNISDTQEWLATFGSEQKQIYVDFEKLKNEEIDKLKQRIIKLLPDAMTAGLASAYEEKRKTEEEERKSASKSFNWAIGLLAATSLIPVAVSLYNLSTDSTLEQVIKNLPHLAFAILPLYLPLFWLAMSANKRVKLSKRLIEEYSHKEALSKTFEGLSTQIAEMDDGEMAKDLRTRLLYNMVSLSAENPGTLIPDFHESDNPLFETLNKSISLSQSLEKLSAVPGIKVVLQNVIKSQNLAKEEFGKSVKQAVDLNESIENEEV